MRLKSLQAASVAALVLSSSFLPIASAAQANAPDATIQNGAAPNGVQNDTTGRPGLPQAPEPTHPGPLYLRDTDHDYLRPKGYLPNPLGPYTVTYYPSPRLTNTPRLRDLLRNGSIYLSLNDAITLALENNFDIAIARINLDIADTDILRARAGGTLRGVSTGLVTGTLGGTSTTTSTTTTTSTVGSGSGGTSSGSGGSGSGASGLVLSTNGAGPVPEVMDPYLTGTLQYESATTQQSTPSISGGNTVFANTATYNFGYTQGFITGTQLAVTYDNSRQTTNSTRTSYSPLLQGSFRAQVTQHLLQGFGWGVNGRFIVQAKNDRRITDSAFRQQVIYTVTQIESIYWQLVSAYEDYQAKTRALQQSTKLAEDNRKQLQQGTLAPLDIVTSDNALATDQQALITSQTTLEYQQLLMKQAIARNLSEQDLSSAPVIPTDRVDLGRTPEEDLGVEDLVRMAFANNPQIEQAQITMANNNITRKALKNGLLPTVDAYGFYGSSALGGAQSPNCQNITGSGSTCTITPAGYGTVFQNLFNNSYPDYGVGVNINIPIRNRVAQADQVRSQMEYQQSEMRLQQLYVQMRMQVINDQYALTNDRAAVQAAQMQRNLQSQALEAEQRKYRLGASTTANVLQQERNLATAEDNLITIVTTYARDRSSLYQVLANTLDRYGISLNDAATGTVNRQPTVPGLAPPRGIPAAMPLTQTPPPMPNILPSQHNDGQRIPPADESLLPAGDSAPASGVATPPSQ